MRLTDEPVSLNLEAAANRPSSAIRSLSVLEVYILKSRGYLPHITLSDADIGALLGMTRQAVEHIERQALRHLAEEAGLKQARLAIGAEDAA